ncbi:uncharacterized protein T551_03743, partial [Pneumocystis jirovecii RU7]
HSLARAVARAVKRQAQQGTPDKEEIHLFALIVEKDHSNSQECKKKLEKYCKELISANLSVVHVHKKLKDLCVKEKQEEKCQKLTNEITKICNDLPTKIQAAYQNPLSSNCIEYEQQCLFLERACSNDITENCNKLRNVCYQKKRDDVALEILLRALKEGNLKEQNKCKEDIAKKCPELSKESDELMLKCLSVDETCTNLIKLIETRCKSLKTDITTAFKSQDKLKEKCPLLLEQCHFYKTNCGTDKPDCDKLINSCKKKEVTYIAPGSSFNPIEPETTLVEQIGLKELYEEAKKEGVFIGKPSATDATALLAFLIQDKTLSASENKGKCEEILKKRCEKFKNHIVLKDLCNDKNPSEEGKKKCNNLDQELAEYIKTISIKINKHLLGSDPKKFIKWHELITFLTERDCTWLLSDCFYLQDQTPVDKECKNLRAACYKKGRNALANQALQDMLRGKLHESNGTWFGTLLKELVNACVNLKEKNDELFTLCVLPRETAFTLLADLQIKVEILQGYLNEKRDFPKKEDCKELLKKCEDLGHDSKEIEWPCHTLKYHCDRLKNIEKLEEKLLAEKTKSLDNFDSCVEKIGQQCYEWNRRGKTKFILACVTQNTTCKILTKNIESKCTILEKRIKASNVVDQAKNNEKESICDSWQPYCSKFMSSCKNLINNGNGECEKLNEECKSFIERKDLEEKVVYELKGSLKTKKECKKTLNIYCTQWTNATNQLKTLCTDTTNVKNDTEVREKLCEKLVERVKSQCPELQKKLAEANKELEKKASKYENIKKEAEDAMKKASLVLSKAKAENNKSENEVVPSVPAAPSGKDTKPFRLIRRDATAKVTEDEAKAFDLVAQAFGLYVELREECQDLLKGCGFKKECSCENQCEKIENTCKKLKPLEVKPYKIETVTKNITTTTTTTTTKTEGEGKTAECQSLQTTDTWVTKTSTHTSTSTTTSTVTSRITLTSTRRCKPTKCTTGEGDEAGEVKPSEGLRMSGWSVMRGVLVVMMISFMI